jgi:hypothetical protein
MAAPAGPTAAAGGPPLWEVITRRLEQGEATHRRRLEELQAMDPGWRADTLIAQAADLAEAVASHAAGRCGIDAVREAAADVCVECVLVFAAACLEGDQG